MRPDVPLPERANQTTPERPWPVRLLSTKIAEYVARMTPVWVEGQIVQLNRRPGATMAFLTLRDTDANVSLPVKINARHLPEVAERGRVVVHAKPDSWMVNGSLSLMAREIRPVGLGDLLARIEQLKRTLAAEGLFAPERKVALPFLPRRIGLICGRESKAEHDVVVNARARWPGARFDIREVAVQGPGTVEQVSAALAELDALAEVDVIVIARGGGSVEDLLPFSNEQLVRAAAASRTPIVSAIGHETDTPLLDLVADYRASTPTAAAKRVVPDVAEERRTLLVARQRLRASITGRLRAERALLDSLRSRPVLADPTTMVTTRERDVAALLDTLRQTTTAHLERHTLAVDSLRRHLRALSPLATLERGYAVLRTADGHVVRDAAEVTAGRLLDARVARGRLAVEVRSAHPAATPGSATPEP